MPKIIMIPARKRTGTTTEETPKFRVAAYCRVSTDMDEQLTSYEAQIAHYSEYISRHPGWELADIYADGGISGTNTKKREKFKRMIGDCMNGRIDMVITKSISRFARNTLDCLKYIRQLKAKNIAVFFEKENINTLDAKGEVCLTIMASLAQQESQSLSQNVRLGFQYRYQQGKVQVCTNRFLDYDKDNDGNLVINPEEAEIMRRIYNERLVPQYYVENNHEAIIPRHIYMLVQEEMVRRARLETGTGKRRVYSGKFALSSIVYCAHCGDIYQRTHWLDRGVDRPMWRCASRLRKKTSGIDCPARTISETDLHASVVMAVNQVIERKDELLPAVKKRLESKSCGNKKNSADKRMAELDARLESLQQELLKKANAKGGIDALLDEIDAVREDKQKLLLENAANTSTLQQLDEFEAFFEAHPAGVTEYDESLVRKLIEKVTVYDDHMSFEFKSGLKTDVMA